MSARRWAAVALALAAAAACRRETRHLDDTPRGAVERNAYIMAEGKTLYAAFNCVGCHAQGGGGMGPALMDTTWIYGGEPERIYESIAQGRPNGMPAFADRIPADRIWWLVAYVRSLSGQGAFDARPGRDDHMQRKKSEYMTERRP